MENIVKQDLSNDKLIVMEIANELIKTLGNMPSGKADEIVRSCAERLLREVVGLKGSIRNLGYNCVLRKTPGNEFGGSGEYNYKFVEE
jgi:hypothetical protein